MEKGFSNYLFFLNWLENPIGLVWDILFQGNWFFSLWFPLLFRVFLICALGFQLGHFFWARATKKFGFWAKLWEQTFLFPRKEKGAKTKGLRFLIGPIGLGRNGNCNTLFPDCWWKRKNGFSGNLGGPFQKLKPTQSPWKR